MNCVLDNTSMFRCLWFSITGIIGREENQLIFLRTPGTIVETRFDCLKLAYGGEIHSRGSYVCLVLKNQGYRICLNIACGKYCSKKCSVHCFENYLDFFFSKNNFKTEFYGLGTQLKIKNFSNKPLVFWMGRFAQFLCSVVGFMDTVYEFTKLL